MWTVDTAAPPVPTIKDPPDNPTFDTSGDLHFDDAEVQVGYECAVDAAGFGACTDKNHERYSLPIGDHCIAVRALDAAANRSASTKICWTIVTKNSFGISSNLTQAFGPGVEQTVDLSLSNPYSFDLRVTDITVTVQSRTTKNGVVNPDCNGTANLLVTRQFSATPNTVIIPRNSTRTLSALGIPEAQWPKVQMPNLPTSQDPCTKTTFALTYAGNASKA
jgi:hypothetical protein